MESAASVTASRIFAMAMLEKDTSWSINRRKISTPEVCLLFIDSSDMTNNLEANVSQKEVYFSLKDFF